MPRRTVFICYSREDEELVLAFRTQLAPFIQQGLEVWLDLEIRAGDEWEKRIHETIDRTDAAVLMVSPDLLASDYVVREELPRLVEHAESGRLRLTSLYLRAAHPEEMRFSGVPLTQYQGLNQPTEPVASLPGQRDAALADAAAKLWQMLEELAPRTERRRAPAGRVLTVELRVRGGKLDRRFSRPDARHFHSNSTPFDLGRLQALAAHCDGETLADALGEALLGGDNEATAVIAKGFGADSPLLHGVRVRILTEALPLRALPWSLARLRQFELTEYGWTFELALGPTPTHTLVRLSTPCSAGMVAAEPAGRRLASVHHLSLERLFGRAWNNPPRQELVRLARTRSEVEALLANPPRLLYFFGEAIDPGAGLELALVDGAFPWRHFTERLAQLPSSRAPQVVFLHSVGATTPALAPPAVPFFLHLQRSAIGPPELTEAQGFWADLLERRLQPIEAANTFPIQTRKRAVVAVDYERWEIESRDLASKEDRPRARLDRRRQREMIVGAVRDLVDHRRRKIVFALAYGAQGSLVEHFSTQVKDTLKDWAKDLARIHSHPLSLPDRSFAPTPAAFEEAFREQMGLQPGQGLADAFRSERLGGTSALPVHFLDWGSHGPGALREGEILACLTFCIDRLASACPEHRLLAYLALVRDEDRHAGLENWFSGLAEQPQFRQPHCDLILLPALGKITGRDLRHFLEVEENTSCPPEYLHDLPERIVHHTGGDFEATVALLEDAERTFLWPELYETLPDSPTPATPFPSFVP
jgi:hypothetical protein